MHALGAAQGLFLASILAGRRRSSTPNRLLALTMLAFSIDLAMAVYHAAGYDARFPHLIGIDFPLAFLYGPLLYLYTRTLSRGEGLFRGTWRWHFVPFLLVVVALLPFYFQSAHGKIILLNSGLRSPWARPLEILNHLKLISASGYIVAVLYELRLHRRRVRETRSSTDRVNLTWLRNLVIGMVGLTALAVILYALSLGSDRPVMGLDPTTPYDDYMLLGLAVLVYAIGYLGLRQPEIFHPHHHRGSEDWLDAEAASQAGGDVARPGAGPTDQQDAGSPSERRPYARSGMDDATASRYEETLRLVMETEKPYRRGDLTLQDLADITGMSPHNLTEVINTKVGQNFYDFVNGYRVQEVQRRLADPTSAHLTLLAIGLDAGFNSKSTFNAVFKKHTHMTPSAYRDAAARTPHPVG